MSKPVVFWVSLLAALLISPATNGQTPTQKDLDARIENQLYDVLKLGTDIYNRGSFDSCYRLYQGSLMVVLGFLDHRPDQVAKIQKALRESDNLLNVKDRAFALRDAIDNLRAAIKVTHTVKVEPGKTTPAKDKEKTPAPPAKPTLWERLGGELTVTLISEDLVNRVLSNPRINFSRRGTGNEWDANPEKISQLKKQFLLFLSSATGGPLKYSGKAMKETHQKMKITDPEFDVMITELTATLDKFFISPDEKTELLRIFNNCKKDIVDPNTVIRPLWERLGGEPALTLVVDDFFTRVARNPNVNFTRKGAGKEWAGTPEEITRLKRRLIQFISSVSEGPEKYDGKSMKAAHEGMKITEAEFTALVADFKASMDQLKVNIREQEEILKLINSTKNDIVEKK